MKLDNVVQVISCLFIRAGVGGSFSRLIFSPEKHKLVDEQDCGDAHKSSVEDIAFIGHDVTQIDVGYSDSGVP